MKRNRESNNRKKNEKEKEKEEVKKAETSESKRKQNNKNKKEKRKVENKRKIVFSEVSDDVPLAKRPKHFNDAKIDLFINQKNKSKFHHTNSPSKKFMDKSNGQTIIASVPESLIDDSQKASFHRTNTLVISDSDSVSLPLPVLSKDNPEFNQKKGELQEYFLKVSEFEPQNNEMLFFLKAKQLFFIEALQKHYDCKKFNAWCDKVEKLTNRLFNINKQNFDEVSLGIAMEQTFLLEDIINTNFEVLSKLDDDFKSLEVQEKECKDDEEKAEIKENIHFCEALIRIRNSLMSINRFRKNKNFKVELFVDTLINLVLCSKTPNVFYSLQEDFDRVLKTFSSETRNASNLVLKENPPKPSNPEFNNKKKELNGYLGKVKRFKPQNNEKLISLRKKQLFIIKTLQNHNDCEEFNDWCFRVEELIDLLIKINQQNIDEVSSDIAREQTELLEEIIETNLKSLSKLSDDLKLLKVKEKECEDAKEKKRQCFELIRFRDLLQSFYTIHKNKEDFDVELFVNTLISVVNLSNSIQDKVDPKDFDSRKQGIDDILNALTNSSESKLQTNQVFNPKTFEFAKNNVFTIINHLLSGFETYCPDYPDEKRKIQFIDFTQLGFSFNNLHDYLQAAPPILFIRKCYIDIANLIFNAPSSYKTFLVTGSPGIGKSAFMLYLMFKILEKRKNQLLDKEAQKTTENEVVFSFQCLRRYSFRLTGKFVEDTQSWKFKIEFGKKGEFMEAGVGGFNFVDSIYTDLSSPGITIMLNSPGSVNPPKIGNKMGARKVLYMPLWTKDELTLLNKISVEVADRNEQKQNKTQDDLEMDRFLRVNYLEDLVIKGTVKQLRKTEHLVSPPSLKDSTMKRIELFGFAPRYLRLDDEGFREAVSLLADKLVNASMFSSYLQSASLDEYAETLNKNNENGKIVHRIFHFKINNYTNDYSCFRNDPTKPTKPIDYEHYTCVFASHLLGNIVYRTLNQYLKNKKESLFDFINGIKSSELGSIRGSLFEMFLTEKLSYGGYYLCSCLGRQTEKASSKKATTISDVYSARLWRQMPMVPTEIVYSRVTIKTIDSKVLKDGIQILLGFHFPAYDCFGITPGSGELEGCNFEFEKSAVDNNFVEFTIWLSEIPALKFPIRQKQITFLQGHLDILSAFPECFENLVSLFKAALNMMMALVKSATLPTQFTKENIDNFNEISEVNFENEVFDQAVYDQAKLLFFETVQPIPNTVQGPLVTYQFTVAKTHTISNKGYNLMKYVAKKVGFTDTQGQTSNNGKIVSTFVVPPSSFILWKDRQKNKTSGTSEVADENIEQFAICFPYSGHRAVHPNPGYSVPISK